MPEVVLTGFSDPGSSVVITSSDVISLPYFITALTYYSTDVDINNTFEVWVSPDDNTNPDAVINGVKFFPSPYSPSSVVPSTFPVRFRSDYLNSNSNSYLKLRHSNLSSLNITVVCIVEIQSISVDRLRRLRR